MSLPELHRLREKSNHLYYNTDNTGGISDEAYDTLIDIIQEKEGTITENPVGAVVKHSHQCSLPYYLGSMNKFKEQHEIDKWVNKFNQEHFILEDKLDGVSCLLITDNKSLKLYTRGDGNVGTDISHFSHLFNNLPKKQKTSLAIRGELIMKKSVFDSKYKVKFANARNLISGIINSKTIKEEARDIDFIPYEIINNSLPLQSQFIILKKLFGSIVNHRLIHTSEMTCDILIRNLIDMKASSEYEIDGIIIHTTAEYIRNTSSNPIYAFAFKTRLDSNIIDSEVEYVEWNITKWNVYKPRIKIKPITLCGVTIQYTSGFNAKYIQDNSLGKGAIVSMTRSNDVIPYIVQVKKQGIVEFPENFEWNATGVDIVSINDEDNSEIKKIVSFLSEIGVKHVSDSTVLKMFESGYDSLIKILNASKNDFSKIEGFGEKLSERTFNNIHNALEKTNITAAICASSCFGFGFGKKKIEKLLKHVPDFYKKEGPSMELLKQIMSIDGFSHRTATQAINHLPAVQEFVRGIGKFVNDDYTSPAPPTHNIQTLTGQIIVFSGFRDKELEAWIITNGGEVGNTVSKNTTLVLAKDINESSSKLKKAREYNVPIKNKDTFVKK